MRIAKAVRDYLRATSGVSDLVGQHVYVRRAPANIDFPYVIVSVAATEFITRSNAPRQSSGSHKIQTRVQIDSYCSEKTSVTAEQDVEDLSEAVAAAFDDKRGTVQGISVQRAVQVDERDNYEWLQDGSDDGVHRITQDYEVTYSEPT